VLHSELDQPGHSVHQLKAGVSGATGDPWGGRAVSGSQHLSHHPNWEQGSYRNDE